MALGEETSTLEKENTQSLLVFQTVQHTPSVKKISQGASMVSCQWQPISILNTCSEQPCVALGTRWRVSHPIHGQGTSLDGAERRQLHVLCDPCWGGSNSGASTSREWPRESY